MPERPRCGAERQEMEGLAAKEPGSVPSGTCLITTDIPERGRLSRHHGCPKGFGPI